MLVICNGMLRSGSTLQYNMAALVIEKYHGANRLGFFSDMKSSAVAKNQRFYTLSENFYILKTHDFPFEKEFYDNNTFLLFTYRDLRDIAASLRKKWNPSFGEIINSVDKMIELHSCINSIPGVLIQPYEKIKNRPEQAIGEIAQFIKVLISSKDQKDILANLQNLKNKNKSYISAVKRRILPGQYDPKTLIHDDHISESDGAAGDWNVVFNKQEIKTLTERYQPWLLRFGYY